MRPIILAAALLCASTVHAQSMLERGMVRYPVYQPVYIPTYAPAYGGYGGYGGGYGGYSRYAPAYERPRILDRYYQSEISSSLNDLRWQSYRTGNPWR